MPDVRETRESFSFEDLGASATLVRVRSERPQRLVEFPIVNWTHRGLAIYGVPEERRYLLDTNALIMQRARIGLRDLLQGRPAVVEDVAHLSEVPVDDSARLAAVREEVEALIRFSDAYPDWKGVRQEPA